jgi:multiple sugar transport system ATP-binding protein
MFEVWPQGVVDITVELSELLGAETNIYSNIDGDPIIAAVPSRDDLAPGQPLKLVFDLNHVHFFDEDTEKIINENADRAQAKDDDDLDI